MKMGNISIFKIVALVLALLMSLSAVACGGITPDTEGGEDVVETEGTEKPRFEGDALSVGDSVTMGVYFDESEDEMLPLKWQVIKVEKDRALIITEKCIEHIPFEKTAYKPGVTVNWASSSLREYLHGEFYEVFFTNKEREPCLISRS